MQAMERVPVYAAPASEGRVGTVADGTLAHVAQVNGTWVRVVTLGLQVVVQQLRGREVLVSGVADPSFRGRVPRSVVQELAPQPPDCGEDPPGAAHGD